MDKSPTADPSANTGEKGVVLSCGNVDEAASDVSTATALHIEIEERIVGATAPTPN